MSDGYESISAPLKKMFMTYFEIVEATVNWVENEVQNCLGSSTADTGVDLTRAEASPVQMWGTTIHAANNTGKSFDIACTDCRQLGGGETIPARLVRFHPTVVPPGGCSVKISIDMSDYGVGIWIADVVSRHDQRPLCPPIMPTWAR